MSRIAFSVFSSYLSGTREHTIFVNSPSSFIKKNPMNTIEKSAIPKLVTKDAADPITEGNTAGLKICWNSWKTAISIRKSCPSDVNLPRRKLLNSARGIAMPLTAFSILVIETPFTMLLTIGIITNTIENTRLRTRVIDNVASIHEGADLPFIFIFFISVINGFAINDTTTATSIYASTLLKYQQIAPPATNPAASNMYFASLSVYLSFCSIINFVIYFACALLWHKRNLSLHQQTGKQLNFQVMNTDNTFECLNAMFSSESSYLTLVEMINEMDLEVTDIRLC